MYITKMHRVKTLCFLFALDAELTTSHYCHNAQDKKFAKIERYLEIKILIKEAV